MPVPPFDHNGLLPAGRHTCTVDEVEVAFVDAFPTSTHRRPIFDRWRLHLLALRHLIQIVEQWVDGSFVEDKVDPNDVDVATVIDGPAGDTLAEEVRTLIWSICQGKHTAQFWFADSYLIARYPPGHIHHAASQAALQYWHDWWGNTRPTDPRGHLPKGYVVVQ